MVQLAFNQHFDPYSWNLIELWWQNWLKAVWIWLNHLILIKKNQNTFQILEFDQKCLKSVKISIDFDHFKAFYLTFWSIVLSFIPKWWKLINFNQKLSKMMFNWDCPLIRIQCLSSDSNQTDFDIWVWEYKS